MNSIIEKTLMNAMQGILKEDIDQLSKMGVVISARAGEFITGPNDEDFSVYICLSGAVKVNFEADSGEEVSITYLSSGDIFGELSAVDLKERSASCIAKTDCSLFKINQKDVQVLLNTNIRFCRAILLMLARRVRETDYKLYRIGKLSAGRRIADELINLAQTSVNHPDQAEIPFIPKQQELALLAMVSREQVSRTLKKLTQEGLILKSEDQKLLIHSVENLKTFFAS